MTVVREFIVRNRKFTIVKKDGFFCAIEDKYITDGKLNTALNGLQMHASKDLNICLNTVKACVEVDHLVQQGMSRQEAVMAYFELQGVQA